MDKHIGTKNLAYCGSQNDRDFWFNYAENVSDRLPFFLQIPNTDFNYIVYGDIYQDAFPLLDRLKNIRQLGTVSGDIVFFGADGLKRSNHSLFVAALSELALARSECDEHERTLGICSGLLHDIATPPFSEQGKLGSNGMMDEEKNIIHYLKKENVSKFLRKYNVREDEIIETINGNGRVGKLINGGQYLDLDQVSYTLYDMGVIINSIKLINTEHSQNLLEIADFLDKINKFSKNGVGNVWKNAFFNGDDVVYEDTERIREFLIARALMFSNVYRSPKVRARDAYIEKILGELWKEEKLTREALLEMDDDAFLCHLNKHIDLRTINRLFVDIGPEFEEVERIYDDVPLEEVEKKCGDKYVAKKFKGFKPLTKTNVLVNDNIIPFDEFSPESAREIKEISDSLQYIGVYKSIF